MYKHIYRQRRELNINNNNNRITKLFLLYTFVVSSLILKSKLEN